MNLPIEAAGRTARDSGAEPAPANPSRRMPRVMGIVTVTPDSFSDGGVHFDSGVAVEAALRMESEGAEIIDVGGESTRPGSDTVPVAEELRRVVPVLREIRRQSRVLISVDSRKSEVAVAALEAGASMVNDVTALAGDSRMAAVVRNAAASVILMHMRGEPKTMQQEIHFEDLIGELSAELRERRDAAIAAGIAPDRIFIDPGIGFGKTFEHNLEILARLRELAPIAPLVVGASRKAFIGQLTGKVSGPDRMAGSLAAVAAAASAGADIVRVHDVAETSDFLRVLGAVEERRG